MGTPGPAWTQGFAGPPRSELPEGILSPQLARRLPEERAPHSPPLCPPRQQGLPPKRGSWPALVFVVKGLLAECRTDSRKSVARDSEASTLRTEPARNGPDLSNEVLTCSSQTAAPNHRPCGHSRPRGGHPDPQLPRDQPAGTQRTRHAQNLNTELSGSGADAPVPQTAKL